MFPFYWMLFGKRREKCNMCSLHSLLSFNPCKTALQAQEKGLRVEARLFRLLEFPDILSQAVQQPHRASDALQAIQNNRLRLCWLSKHSLRLWNAFSIPLNYCRQIQARATAKSDSYYSGSSTSILSPFHRIHTIHKSSEFSKQPQWEMNKRCWELVKRYRDSMSGRSISDRRYCLDEKEAHAKRFKLHHKNFHQNRSQISGKNPFNIAFALYLVEWISSTTTSVWKWRRAQS